MFKKIKAKLKTENLMQIADLSIRVIRTSRRSISLQVKPEGIIMRSPLMCSESELQRFAKQKYAWLLKRSQSMQEQLQAAHKNFVDGEQFKFFDKTLTLKIHRNNAADTHYIENELHITISKRVKDERAYIKRKLHEWYKQQALNHLQNRTAEIAQTMNLEYQSIKVRDYKARWGSCSSTGELSFNWRIIMAPLTAVDSVIVHELAHLKHFNHSKRFWQLVYKTEPNYAAHHDWFNQNRLALMF